MNIETVTKEIRDLLSSFITKIKGSTALGLTDINKFSEVFILELFRELYNISSLRNLNIEKKNFPGLDLGDDVSGMAFQVTATSDLTKVKDTLLKVIDNKLYERFSSIQIFVITEKQTTYSQTAIDKITQGLFQFNVARDIIDYRDILSICATLELDHLIRVFEVLKKHLTLSNDVTTQSSKHSYFPEKFETVELNIVPIWIPPKLYLADFISLVKPQSQKKSGLMRMTNQRDIVSKKILERGFEVPEDFDVHNGQLLSFQNLSESVPALDPYFDKGTVTDLNSKDFYSIDNDYLNVFKSLLRRCLQRQLKREKVFWQHKLHLFFFGIFDNEEERKVIWKGDRTAERVVYKRTMKNNKPDEILTCKHLAFEVGFHLIDKEWHLSITPTWFFSRDGYHKDDYGAEHISWLKRKENDQQVHTHFRFILSRLKEIQEQSGCFYPTPRKGKISLILPRILSHDLVPQGRITATGGQSINVHFRL